MYALWNILSLVIAAASMLYAYSLFQQIMRKDAGDETMQKIARAVSADSCRWVHDPAEKANVFANAFDSKLFLRATESNVFIMEWPCQVVLSFVSVRLGGQIFRATGH